MSLVGWRYSKEVIIDNTNNDNSYENNLVCINLTSNNFDFSKSKPDGSDIRFTDSDGTTLLDYWIEDYSIDNQTATIYVKVPSILTHQTKSIYMYYGNLGAISQSDKSVMTSGFQYNPDPFNDGSCVAFYPLDGNANDYSGNGNDVVIHGNVGFTTGKFDQSVDYVNKTADDYIATTDPIQRHGSKEITICGWINVVGHTGKWVNLWQLSPDNNSYTNNSRQPGLWLADYNNSKFSMRNDGIYTKDLGIYPSQGSITYNQWHFICQVVTLRQMKLYINGQLTDTYTSNEDFKFNDGWLYIGNKWSVKNHLIDHVRIFNKALTKDEVQILHQYQYPPCSFGDEQQHKSKLFGVACNKYGIPIVDEPVKVSILDKNGSMLITSISTTTGYWEFNDVPADPGSKVLVVYSLEGRYHDDNDIAGAAFKETI